MIKNYRSVVRNPLQLQQVVHVNQETELEDGSLVFLHTTQPVYAPPAPLPQYRDPTVEDLLEIVRLKKEDPDHWTNSRLVEKFRVRGSLIKKIAPTPEERLKRLEEAKLEASFEKKRKKKNTGKGLAKMQRMNTARFKKMVEEAGGLKQLMRSQNFVTDHRRKKEKKEKPMEYHFEPLHATSDDAPLKTREELDSLIDWVTPMTNIRELGENRANIFKMNEDPNYKAPGPIPKATPPPAAAKPGAAPAGGKGAPPSKGAPAGGKAAPPPPKKK